MKNKVIPKEYSHDVYHVDHHVIDAFRTINPGTPYLIMFFISVFIKIDHHYKFMKQFEGKTRFKTILKKLKK